MYGLNSNEEIPILCKTEQTAWDELISHIWSVLLTRLVIPHDATIIEIGPGVSAKVGLALSRLDYDGKLYVLDASQEAIAALSDKYKACLPRARIYYVHGCVGDCLPALPQQPDILLASHVIDDMLMLEGMKRVASKSARDVFSWSSAGEYEPAVTDEFAMQWESLRNEDWILDEAKRAVGHEWEKIIDTLRPQYMIMSQYPSATLTENGLDSLNDHSSDIFYQLKRRYQPHMEPDTTIQTALNTIKHYNHAHIGNHILNAVYWMSYRHESI